MLKQAAETNVDNELLNPKNSIVLKLLTPKVLLSFPPIFSV